MNKIITGYYLTDKHHDGGIVRVVSMTKETATIWYVRDRNKKEFTVNVSDLYIVKD